MEKKPKKEVEKKPKKGIEKRKIIVGSIFALILAFAISYVIYQKVPSGEKPAAIVNGKEIPESRIQDVKRTFYAQTRKELSDEKALESLIVEALLLEEAERRGIELSLEEAESLLKRDISAQGHSLDELKTQFEGEGGDYEQVLNDYKAQVTIRRLGEQLAEENEVKIGDDEARGFYEENKGLIFQQVGNVSYENISVQLKATMEQEEERRLMNNFVQNLRSDAQIEIIE